MNESGVQFPDAAQRNQKQATLKANSRYELDFPLSM
jgi:hypothetical protein